MWGLGPGLVIMSLSLQYAYAVLRDRNRANGSVGVDGGAGNSGDGGGDEGGEIGGEIGGDV